MVLQGIDLAVAEDARAREFIDTITASIPDTCLVDVTPQSASSSWPT